MPCWLLLLSSSIAISFLVFFKGIADVKEVRKLEGVDESLKAEPERLLEVVAPDESLEDPNLLRKNGRSVGMQAATMTTFCSILG